MNRYKVTYNPKGNKTYKVIEASQPALGKRHAMDLVYAKHGLADEFTDRSLYKAKLLKDQ